VERSIKGTLVGTRWTRRFKRKILASGRRAEGQTVNIFSVENSALEQVLTRSPDPASYKESKIIKSERKIMVVRLPLEVGGTIKSVYMKQHSALSLGHRLASLCRYPSAAMRSLSGALALLEKGYATSAPVAAVEYRRWGVLLKSLYVSEEISDAKTVETFWRDELSALKGVAGKTRRRFFLRRLAHLLRSLHENRIYHNDLKASNILVPDRGAASETIFSLIDLQGLRKCFFVSSRRRIKNLAQLNRTLGVHLTWAEKLFFFKSYGNRRFHSRRKKRALVQRILDQTSRQTKRESQRRAAAEPCPSVEVSAKNAEGRGKTTTLSAQSFPLAARWRAFRCLHRRLGLGDDFRRPQGSGGSGNPTL
jgi:serine/threonine protein kinase